MIEQMKRILTWTLCAALCAALAAVPVSAAHVSAGEAIETLETLGLVRGTGSGFEPERNATRAEAAVMLLRLLGKERAAESAAIVSPFSDSGWADAYLGYAYDRGLVRGLSDTSFGSGSSVSARDYVTMTLRALGYADGVDFTWQGSLIFADGLGLTNGEYSARPDDAFLREDMALVSYTALTLKQKGSDLRLIEQLWLDGAVSAEAVKATRLASALNTEKPAYSAAEIYEMTSSAVVFTESFQREADLLADKPGSSGSGFFITADGAAVMSYHQLEGAECARVTTTAGRVFPISGVLYYDTQRDIAVVRVSRTDSKGNQVRFFPTVPLGDSDAVSTGEEIFTVSSPLGLMDSISAGLVSNRSRIVDDPAYPCIQISAPISHGSSGGPLLNASGEAIGVLYASYTSGQNLNLAVPLNAIRGVRLDGAGTPLREVLRIENEKKAKATLTASTTYLTLRPDEERDVVISTDCPGQPSIMYEITDSTVVFCTWQSFTSRTTVPLRFTGVSTGTADVIVSFASGYGNEDASVVIHVTVT